MTRLFARFAIVGLFGLTATASVASPPSMPLPAPAGLRACAVGDPTIAAVSGVAAKLGGEFLGCFLSDKTITSSSSGKVALLPSKSAFAIALQGDAYSTADLERLLAGVREQWKNFDPLDGKLKDSYIANLNDMIGKNGSPVAPEVISIKPILVSIDRSGDAFYTITSIRTYVFETSGQSVMLTKVDGSAVVLRGTHLIRLTLLQTLNDPADVAQVKKEIFDWARLVAQH